MDATTQTHLSAIHAEWLTLKKSLASSKLKGVVSLNGSDLSVAEVIAVSLYVLPAQPNLLKPRFV